MLKAVVQTSGASGNNGTSPAPPPFFMVPSPSHHSNHSVSSVNSPMSTDIQPIPPSALAKVLYLCKHRHSFDQYDRQVATILKACKENSQGFYLRDLETVTEIINITVERLKQDRKEFAQPLCAILDVCCLPFIKECSSDEFRHFRQICTLIKTIVQTLLVPNDRIHEATCMMLSEYATVDENVSSYHHQILVGADIVNDLAEAVHQAENDPQKMKRLAGLFQKFTVSAELGSKLLNSGVIDLMHGMLNYCDHTDAVVPIVVEILWNVMEHVPNGAVAIGTPSLFDNIHHQLSILLQKGHRLHDKQLRNELLALCVLLLSADDNLAFAAESELTSLLIRIAIAAEISPADDSVGSFCLSNAPEDFEMKVCALNLLTRLTSDGESCSVICSSPFIAALFIHLDSSLQAHPARAKYPRSQSIVLICTALSCLAELVPKAQEQFCSMDGNRVLLELMAIESEESIRLRVLSVMMACADLAEFQDELGALGAIPLLLSLVSDVDHHPPQIRQDAISVLSKLCSNHTENKQRFGGQHGVEVLLQCAQTSASDQMRIEPTVLSVVDCIWSTVCGLPQNEALFLMQNGIAALLNILEVCPEVMQTQVLSCLSDFLENAETRNRVMAWRSRMTRRGAVQLLLDMWINYEKSTQDLLTLDSNSLVDAITKKNVLTKIYAVIKRIDVESVRPLLSIQHQTTLVDIDRFVETKKDVLWQIVSRELDDEGIRPVTPDARSMKNHFVFAEENENTSRHMKSLLLDTQKHAEQQSERAFFDRVAEEHIAKQINANRLRHPVKAPYVNRTKVIIPKSQQVDDAIDDYTAKVRVDVEEESSEEGYLRECLQDEGVDALIAATTARDDKRFAEQQRSKIETTRSKSNADDDGHVSALNPTPRGSGMDAARTLARSRQSENGVE